MSPLVALVALGAATVALASPSGADVSEVSGSAFGYSATVALFTAPQAPAGPAPTVTLPGGGSASPINATAPSANVRFGPATIFTSGPIEVSTRGTTGAGGSVTSSSKVTRLNTSGQEVLSAESVESTCTASETGVSGSSTTIRGGKLRVSEGDPDVDGDDTDVDIAANPAPNTVIEGKIEAVNDTFRYIFNEQVRNPDGSITVNAAHQVLIGPSATGDLYIGQSKCATKTGSSASTAPTTVRSGGSAATTVPGRTVADTGTGVLPLLLPASALVVAGATAVFLARRRRVAHAGDVPHGRP